MLIDIVKQFNIDFCAVVEQNVTHIVFMLPYLPFKNYPANCARIDAFYIASNTLYKRVKEIEKILADKGFEIVKNHLQLKKVAEQGGLGSILNNQLLVNKQYGSRTTLQAISVREKYPFIANGSVDKKICNSCHKCDDFCPNKALNNGSFVRENCLRHKQDLHLQYFEFMAGRVLGCEECQNACPYNARVIAVDMPQDVAQVFDYKNLFEMIIAGKKGLEPLANLIGSNMARPTFIFDLAVNSLLSAKNYDYTDIIKRFANHSQDAIRNKAMFYLEHIKCNMQNNTK